MQRKMSPDELIEAFLNFENEYKMLEMRINGKRFWHYIRYLIFGDINRIFESGYWPASVSVKAEAQDETFIDFFNRAIKYNQFRAKKRDVLIIPHARKYKDKNGYGRCIYTDLLDQSLKRTHYLLDGKSVNGIYEKQYSKNILYFDLDAFKERMRLKCEYVPVGKVDFDKYVVNPIEEFFETTISLDDKQRWLNRLNSILEQRNYLLRYYTYMLKKIEPKIILMTVAYSPNRMVLCEVAKKSGIPVVELEHGIITKLTLPYNYHKRMRLPWFPDYIFTFGSFEKQNVKYPISDDKIIPVGYPELESHYKKKSKGKKTRKNILFISDCLKEFAQYAETVAEQLDSEQYHIVYKLHPKEYGDWRENYGHILQHSNIEVVGDFSRTIYDYLAEADWVIGNASTVLYEATMFDVKIAVVKLGGYVSLQALYNNDIALLVDSCNDLVKAIKEDCFEMNQEIKVFEKNSISNMMKAIETIIQEG